MALPSDSQPDAEAEKFVNDFLTRLDPNHDREVHYDEAPLSIQRYSFWRFDHNQDSKIDRQELLRTARRD